MTGTRKFALQPLVECEPPPIDDIDDVRPLLSGYQLPHSAPEPRLGSGSIPSGNRTTMPAPGDESARPESCRVRSTAARTGDSRGALCRRTRGNQEVLASAADRAEASVALTADSGESSGFSACRPKLAASVEPAPSAPAPRRGSWLGADDPEELRRTSSSTSHRREQWRSCILSTKRCPRQRRPLHTSNNSLRHVTIMWNIPMLVRDGRDRVSRHLWPC